MFERRFAIETTDRPDVVPRVVMLCRQRRCEVTALSFRAGDRHRHGEFMLSVRASAWHGDRLEAWLRALVDVLDVHEP